MWTPRQKNGVVRLEHAHAPGRDGADRRRERGKAVRRGEHGQVIAAREHAHALHVVDVLVREQDRVERRRRHADLRQERLDPPAGAARVEEQPRAAGLQVGGVAGGAAAQGA